MRAAWRSMTWTIGFLMGTRNLADWWQVLIGLERTFQQQKRPHCRQKAVILLDVGCRCVLQEEEEEAADPSASYAFGFVPGP